MYCPSKLGHVARNWRELGSESPTLGMVDELAPLHLLCFDNDQHLNISAGLYGAIRYDTIRYDVLYCPPWANFSWATEVHCQMLGKYEIVKRIPVRPILPPAATR